VLHRKCAELKEKQGLRERELARTRLPKRKPGR